MKVTYFLYDNALANNETVVMLEQLGLHMTMLDLKTWFRAGKYVRHTLKSLLLIFNNYPIMRCHK